MRKKIDDCIDMLQNADPTGEIQPDSQEMLQLEEQCYMMGPLIDQQLQKIDYKHAVLDDLNIKIIEAFQMYNTLMKESITKTSGNFGNFNPNMQNNIEQQNMNQGGGGGFIPFVAAPPQTSDAQTNPYNLANQLNNFANYNMPSNGDQMMQQQNVPTQGVPNNNNNFQNYPIGQQNMYYGGHQTQIDGNNTQNNAMANNQGPSQQQYSQ